MLNEKNEKKHILSLNLLAFALEMLNNEKKGTAQDA